MNERLIQYKERLSHYWKQYSNTHKYMIIGIFVFLMAAVIIISVNLSKIEYSNAFTDLQPADAAAIRDYLNDANIPYKISADRRSIGVPRSKVSDVILEVESQGLNKNGSLGYGAFDGNSTFGMTENQFNVKLINAVQGELQQMFNGFNGVSSSKVLITVPKDSVFITPDMQEPSAAVQLHFATGYSLTQEQIDTMYNVIAKSVSRLKHENITITNQNGDELSYSKNNNSLVSSASQVTQNMLIKKNFEMDIQKKIMALLGGVLGPNKVIPIATASLNFDKKSSQESLVRPISDDKGIEISSQEVQKSYSSDGASGSGGIAGTGGTDIPGYPGTTEGGKVNSEEFSKIVNSEVDRIQNVIEFSPFSVKDLTISVGIDDQALTPENRIDIERALVSIVAISLADSGQQFTAEQLNSKVTIIAQPFESNTQSALSANMMYLLYGGGAVAIIATGGIIYLVSRNRRRQREQEALEAEIAAAAPTAQQFPTIDIDSVTNESQMRKQLELLAQRKPEDFVNLLRTWLVDE